MSHNTPSQAFTASAETMAFINEHPALNFHTQAVTFPPAENGTYRTDPACFLPSWMNSQPKEGNRHFVRRIENDIIIGYIDETPTKPCNLCQNSLLVELLHLSGLLKKMKVVRVEAPSNGLRVFITLETTEEALIFRTPLGHVRFRMTFRINHFGHQVLCVVPAFNLPNGFDLPLITLDDGLVNEILIDHTGTLEQATEKVLAISNDLEKKSSVFARTLTTLADYQILHQEFFDFMKLSYRKMYDINHCLVSTIDHRANSISTSLVIQNYNRPPKTLLELLSLLAVYLDYHQPDSKQYSQPPGLYRKIKESKEWSVRLMQRFLTDILALCGLPK